MPMPPRPSSRISSYCLIRVPGARSTPGRLSPSHGPAVETAGAGAPRGGALTGPTPNCVPVDGLSRRSMPTRSGYHAPPGAPPAGRRPVAITPPACRAPRGRSTRRTRRSCRRRRAGPPATARARGSRARAGTGDRARRRPACPRSRRARLTSARLVTMSRWLVGSSRTSRFGASKRSFASASARLLAARQHADRLEHVVVVEAERAGEAAQRALVRRRRVLLRAPRGRCGRRRAAPSGAARSSPSSPTRRSSPRRRRARARRRSS